MTSSAREPIGVIGTGFNPDRVVVGDDGDWAGDAVVVDGRNALDRDHARAAGLTSENIGRG